uniref:Uncharacterized protein n=1 Tax=Aegilops tauschii subsp. strangulata TaxID=200361 RepID=A0A452ZRZ3_AEGTS
MRRGWRRTRKCRSSTGPAALIGRRPPTSSSRCPPSARSSAVYLVAQYARSEIKRMEAEAEVKRKKIEEVEKQKQLEADSVKEDADSKLATVLVRLDTLEGVVKEIAEEKLRSPALTKEESLKKGETSSPDKASASKSDGSDSQLASVKIKDTKDATNAPPDATQQDTKRDRGKANGESNS